jgi:hypothetical protein
MSWVSFVCNVGAGGTGAGDGNNALLKVGYRL